MVHTPHPSYNPCLKQLPGAVDFCVEEKINLDINTLLYQSLERETKSFNPVLIYEKKLTLSFDCLGNMSPRIS